MKRAFVLLLCAGAAGCAVGERVDTPPVHKSFFHRRAEAESAPAPAPTAVANAAPAPAPKASEPAPVAKAPPAPPPVAAPVPAQETAIATAPAVRAAPPAPVARAAPPPPPAPASAPEASAAISTAPAEVASAAPPPSPNGPIATNNRAAASSAPRVLDDDDIPDAPVQAAPPNPALFAQAIATPLSEYGKAERIETPLSVAEARARLQDRLTALNFPPPTAETDGFGGGPMLRNPGGFSAEADCKSAGAGGRAVMEAAWVKVKVKKRGRGSQVEIATRYEEVQESPVRGVLARAECRSTGRLEADLLSTVR